MEHLEEEAPPQVLTESEDRLDRADSVYTELQFLKRLKVDGGLRSIQMARAPSDYYKWSLEQRRAFLGAASVDCLCKTIIMKNSEYNEEYKDDPFYPRFIMVIVQYSKKLISQNIAAIMKNH